MKTVKEIYDYFTEAMKTAKYQASLLDFLDTIPEFSEVSEDGISTMNMTLGREYLAICEKMCNDGLLVQVKRANIIGIDPQYIAVDPVNFDTPQEFIQELEYGMYDFKYRGFVYTRETFKDSVLPIVGKNIKTGNEDIGTCYCIGNHMFVTAAHCVRGLDSFNILLPDNSPLKLSEVWFAQDESLDDYDLAVIVCEDVPLNIKAFEMRNPNVLDEVLTMGYPPIPGLNPTLVSESASVASYVKGNQKAATGQVVAEVGSYMSKLDFFVITARVKGGCSGSPIINKEGYVIGTVFQIPFDSQGGTDGGRYDVMGYGVCLPSKYIQTLLDNHETNSLVPCNGAYKEEK